MWFDNETDRDFLNFESIADTIAEMIESANGEPVSIGVSGAWGVGKSSMIRMTRASLEARQDHNRDEKYVFVEFNAWLYQGYDDARAALLDVISRKLSEVAKERETALDKAIDFAGRVKWLRLAKLLALPAAALALGLPPIGLGAELTNVVADLTDGNVTGDDLNAASKGASRFGALGAALLDPRRESSPPQEIQALRDSFEALLRELEVTLVVLIDDLDRCLPPTTVSTLEAIRLLLFLERTAFVIAADDAMIKHAVKRHFEGLEDDALVTNYFDKLIQVPIRVPALGIHEVRAYMTMLFIDDSELDQGSKDDLRKAVAGQLRNSWNGSRVDRQFLEGLGVELPQGLQLRLDTAESLAHIMATSLRIAGNPRLIKRFLNALAIRRAMAKAQGIDVDESVLAKLLVFERVAPASLFHALASAAASDPDGRPRLLQDWEKALGDGEEPALTGEWDDPLVREWLSLSPPLADFDLRGALYVGREQAPFVTDVDRLGSESAKILSALLENPAEAPSLHEMIAAIPRVELEVIMARLIARARQESVWGSPPILSACLEVARADPSIGESLARFLTERPVAQLQASVVPAIAHMLGSDKIFAHWLDSKETSGPVKAAIRQEQKRGDVSK